MNKLQVIFHLSSPEQWKVALNNAQNFINNQGSENIEAEILANASAVKIFDPDSNKEIPSFSEKLKNLFDQKVSIAFCQNALKAHNIPKESLPSFIKIVPAGITELALKQKEGYAYIKP